MKNLTDLKKNVVYGGPKYKSQTKIFDQIETIFEKTLIERDKLIKEFKLIKKTVFEQFCSGESLDKSYETVKKLNLFGIFQATELPVDIKYAPL